ncbi:MAG: hypothetical protein ACJ79V_20375 [Myxococcales bacterium]
MALPWRERGEHAEGAARLDRVIDGPDVGDQRLPSRAKVLEAREEMVLAEAVCLVDRDDAQPRKTRASSRRGSQHDHPRVLVGVLDEFRWGVDGARHGALKLTVMPAMEIADLVPRDRGT